jgi:hypothetical protein
VTRSTNGGLQIYDTVDKPGYSLTDYAEKWILPYGLGEMGGTTPARSGTDTPGDVANFATLTLVGTAAAPNPSEIAMVRVRSERDRYPVQSPASTFEQGRNRKWSHSVRKVKRSFS